MKSKLLIFLIISLIVLGFGIAEISAISEAESAANDILNKDNSNGTTLVVYFSRTGENYNVGNVEVGNTAMVASYIKQYLNADSFEIIPVNKYPESYEECVKVALEEKNSNARPAFEGEIKDFDKYDTVFIGYPIWHGDLPMIMYSLMEKYDFKDKHVYLFNTHEGSGDAGTYKTVQSKLSSSDVNTDGLALDGKTARSDDAKKQTENWLKGLGY